MLLRLVVLGMGLAEFLFPRWVVDVGMRHSVEDDDVEVKPWVYTAARLEGALIVLWALQRGHASQARAERSVPATAGSRH